MDYRTKIKRICIVIEVLFIVLAVGGIFIFFGCVTNDYIDEYMDFSDSCAVCQAELITKTKGASDAIWNYPEFCANCGNRTPYYCHTCGTLVYTHLKEHPWDGNDEFGLVGLCCPICGTDLPYGE